MSQRVAGILSVKVNGELLQGRGEWSYNLGGPVREAVVGTDAIHGFKETLQVPMVEGEISDSPDLDLATLLKVKDATITLELANGKLIALRRAWYAGEGTASATEGSIPCRFEGKSAQEIR